jgi:hypothetical protein
MPKQGEQCPPRMYSLVTFIRSEEQRFLLLRVPLTLKVSLQLTEGQLSTSVNSRVPHGTVYMIAQGSYAAVFKPLR